MMEKTMTKVQWAHDIFRGPLRSDRPDTVSPVYEEEHTLPSPELEQDRFPVDHVLLDFFCTRNRGSREGLDAR